MSIVLMLLSLVKSFFGTVIANPIKTLQVVGPAAILIFLGAYVWHLKHDNNKLTDAIKTDTQVIQTKTETIIKWQTQYNDLNGKLSLSNTRVEQLDASTRQLKSQLSNSQDKIVILNQKLSTRLTQIYSSTVPKTCPEAQQWLGNQLDITLNGWNDNVIKTPDTQPPH
jgi:peptidoglycan hydrolase CwlO-like protein